MQDRYNLIEVEFNHASDAYVTMLPLSGESFIVEASIVASHDKKISQRLEFLLMVKALLETEGKSLDSISQKEIMRRYHIAERTLEKALADLKNR